ncbi:hypothetical protein VIBNIAM115_1350018 [Vibrio nigripulchritudo AM115]|nr:hypothetical protein VIBNIAM115_1350018 [Vibrio nigripulchritudo AM115]
MIRNGCLMGSRFFLTRNYICDIGPKTGIAIIRENILNT